MSTRSKLFSLFAACALLLFTACSSESNDDDTDVSYDAAEYESHGCAHLEFGPDGAATAAATADGTLPDVSANMTRIAVTLVEVEGGNGGFAMFETMADGVHALFSNVAVDLTITDSSGAVVEPLETIAGSDLCDEIGQTIFVDLDPGMYTIEIGPTSETSVEIVPVRPLDGMDMGDMDMGGDMDMSDGGMDMEDGMDMGDGGMEGDGSGMGMP